MAPNQECRPRSGPALARRGGYPSISSRRFLLNGGRNSDEPTGDRIPETASNGQGSDENVTIAAAVATARMTPQTNRTFVPPPEATMLAAVTGENINSQSTEDPLSQAFREQAERLDRKRDLDDPDFMDVGPSSKRRRTSASSPATPTTPTPQLDFTLKPPAAGRSNVGPVKRYNECKDDTKADRDRYIGDITNNWQAPYTEWIPLEILPTGWPDAEREKERRSEDLVPLEPRDWSTPLLERLRHMSELTKSNVRSGKRGLVRAFNDRRRQPGGSNNPWFLGKKDVEAAIRAITGNADQARRSPTLAAVSDPFEEQPPATVDEILVAVNRPVPANVFAPHSAVHVHQSPTPDPQGAGPSKKAGKQPVKSAAALPVTIPVTTPIASFTTLGAEELNDDLGAVDRRIGEIWRLRAEEEKLKARRVMLEAEEEKFKARRIKLEAEQKQWEELQTSGST